MIIVNIFVDFYILVLKGITHLSNGLFLSIKKNIEWSYFILLHAVLGVGHLLQLIVTLFSKILNAIWAAIIAVLLFSYKQIKKVVIFIWSIICAIVTTIRNIIVAICRGIKKTIIFLLNKLKALLLWIYGIIKKICLFIVAMIKKICLFIYGIIKKICLSIYEVLKKLVLAIVNILKKIYLKVKKITIDFLKLVLKGVFFILTFIFKIVFSVIKIIFNGIFFVFKNIFKMLGYLVLYAMHGIKMLLGLIILAIKKVLSFGYYTFMKTIWHYIIAGVTFGFKALVNLVMHMVKGIVVIALLIYKFGLYIGYGTMNVAIFIYNVIMFIPRYVVKSVLHLISNFQATINQYIFTPIQNTAEFLSRTYRTIRNKIKALPEEIKKAALEWYNEQPWVKHMKNKRDMNRQVLMIDFNSQDAKRSDKKIVWQYYAKDENGKFVKGIFEAFSKLDVHSFLMSEGYEVYDIKTSSSIEFFYGGRNSSNKRINMKKMIFFLTQLSTYIRAGIPLTDAVRILSKQEKNKRMQRLYQAIIYELIMGENFSNALEKQGEAFPKLLVNMLKTSEMTGELAETLDDMSEYYNTTHKLRKQTITSMMYPMVVLFFVVVVIVFIMIFVIPQFIEIYKNSDAELPTITVITIAISAFLKKYIVFLIIGVILFIIAIRFVYKRVKIFKMIMQWFVMHIPVIKNVIIYNEITMFTKTFSALLQHNVFITDSMEILSKITNNEIYKMIVFDAISNIARGDSISSSFKNHWAIPPLAYEMMLTGERTGQLPVMMGKVASYYQEEQKNLVNQIKVLIEPIVIVILTGAVGLILLAVVVPMFSLYSGISSGV